LGEPKGHCNIPFDDPNCDKVLVYAEVMNYDGKNWKLNHRWSNTPRYCVGFVGIGKS